MPEDRRIWKDFEEAIKKIAKESENAKRMMIIELPRYEHWNDFLDYVFEYLKPKLRELIREVIREELKVKGNESVGED